MGRRRDRSVDSADVSIPRKRHKSDKKKSKAKKSRRRSHSVSSSGSATSEMSRDTKKRLKALQKEDSRLRKESRSEMKLIEKEAKKEAEYIGKVAKGLDKVLSSNSDKQDKGRPLSLQHAALVSTIQILCKVQSHPKDGPPLTMAAASEELTYLRNTNYGLELLLRVGFEELGEPVFFTFRQKYFEMIPFAVDYIKKVLVGMTAKLEAGFSGFPHLSDTIGHSTLEKLCGTTTVTQLTNKVIGTALGMLCGDVLGLPFSNMTAETIDRWFVAVSDFHLLPPAALDSSPAHGGYWKGKTKTFFGEYSGDLGVGISTALDIVEQRGLDCRSFPRKVAGDYSAFLGHEKMRMFTETLKVLVAKLRSGDDPKQTGLCLNPSGLHGAETHALLPLLSLTMFPPATEGSTTEVSDQSLLDNVKAALLPFVVHSDGIGAGFTYCHIIHYLLRTHVDSFHPKLFLKFVYEKAGLVHMSDYLKRCFRLMEEAIIDENGVYIVKETYLEDIKHELEKAALVGVDDDGSAEEETETVYTSAVGALIAAVYVFVNNVDSPISGISAAIGLGEAGHILGGMVGVFMGALHGAEWVPKSWYVQLEGGDGLSTAGFGRDRVVQLALDCAALKPNPVKHYTTPQAHSGTKYKVGSVKKDITGEDTDVIPQAPEGTNALVAAMPISLRKFHVQK